MQKVYHIPCLLAQAKVVEDKKVEPSLVRNLIQSCCNPFLHPS